MAAERLAEGLARLGYALEPGEAARLLEAVARDGDESVPKAKFLASQIDWAAYQMDFRCLSINAHQLLSFTYSFFQSSICRPRPPSSCSWLSATARGLEDECLTFEKLVRSMPRGDAYLLLSLLCCSA